MGRDTGIMNSVIAYRSCLSRSLGFRYFAQDARMHFHQAGTLVFLCLPKFNVLGVFLWSLKVLISCFVLVSRTLNCPASVGGLYMSRKIHETGLSVSKVTSLSVLAAIRTLSRNLSLSTSTLGLGINRMTRHW